MAEDAKDRILAAASEEFAAKGRAGARMQAIADRADVNKAMLNYYFTSKDQLFDEVVRNMMRNSMIFFKETLQDIDDARTFVRTFVKMDADLLQKDPGMMRLVIHSYLDGDLDLEKIHSEFGFDHIVIDKIKQFMDAGEMRGNDATQVFLHLISLNVIEHLFNRTTSDCPQFSLQINSEKRIDSIIDLLENGLYRE